MNLSKIEIKSCRTTSILQFGKMTNIRAYFAWYAGIFQTSLCLNIPNFIIVWIVKNSTEMTDIIVALFLAKGTSKLIPEGFRIKFYFNFSTHNLTFFKRHLKFNIIVMGIKSNTCEGKAGLVIKKAVCWQN